MGNVNDHGNMNGNGSRLEREHEWLNQLAMDIRQQTGARISRSEIVRAGIAALRELHRFGPQWRFGALTAVKQGSHLGMLAVLAVRCGVLQG